MGIDESGLHMAAAGWRGWSLRHRGTLDCSFCTLLFLCALTGALVMDDPNVGVPTPGFLIPTFIGCAALTLRRRFPLTVLAVNCGAAMAYLSMSYPHGALVVSLELAMFHFALHSRPRAAWIAGGTTAVLITGTAILLGSGPSAKDNLSLMAWTLLATALGAGVRVKHLARRALEERARRAEESREEEARRRVTEERVRIARELHDVLAHHVTLVNVQAGVASHLLDSRPEEARKALAQIRTASRAVLEELRVTVGLLRQAGESAVPTEPAAGLDRLEALAETFGSAGLPVKVEVEGEQRVLPAAVEMAAYRIVQESLTNAHKHAGRPASALVRVVFEPARLRVAIEDDGRSAVPGTAGTGHGLLGKRERAFALGGRLASGPRREGGWRVELVLPTQVAGERDAPPDPKPEPERRKGHCG